MVGAVLAVTRNPRRALPPDAEPIDHGRSSVDAPAPPKRAAAWPAGWWPEAAGRSRVSEFDIFDTIRRVS